jgi:hypothetical protein
MTALDELFERVRKFMRNVGEEGNLGSLLHRAELEMHAALRTKDPKATADNSAMPKLPCAKKWLEWCKVKAVPLDLQWDIYEWFTRQLSA